MEDVFKILSPILLETEHIQIFGNNKRQTTNNYLSIYIYREFGKKMYCTMRYLVLS
jgi:hypothetical protein